MPGTSGGINGYGIAADVAFGQSGRDSSMSGGDDVGRRSFLRAGALGAGMTAVAAGSAAAPAAAAALGRARSGRVPPFALFAQPDMNFETLFTIGAAGYGAAEVGEVVTAVNETNARGASYQTLFDTFWHLANRVAEIADGEGAAGHGVSARSAYLRAASYYDLCLFFVLGTRAHAREATVFAAMQRCWQRAAALADTPYEFVRIPYQNSWLPGYFLRPDASGRSRTTVILNTGSDAQNIDMFVLGGAAALERGYNALIFEGPGQGAMLFERKVGFRPDWQHVITPVVDWLLTRPEVDSRRIALTGWSLCGASVVQAAAFEHRLAAVVAAPGVMDAWLIWPAELRKIFDGGAPKDVVNHIWNLDVVPHLNAVERFTLAKRAELYGKQYLLPGRAGRVFTDLYDLGKTIMRVNCETAARAVTSPTLILNYELDSFATDQAIEVYRALPHGIDKRYYTFTVAQGAQFHDGPMAPQTQNQVIFDWLDDTIG